MHEWALAESIVVAALKEAKKEQLKQLTHIKIGIGELQQISQDIFEFVLKEIINSYGDELKDLSYTISIIPSSLQCRACGHCWMFSDMKNKLSDDDGESIHFIPEVAFVHTRCLKCGSPDFEIKTGRGVEITSITGRK